MLNVNLFGGPGVGKSTSAAGLFHLFKTNHYKCEYIQEYAKELTFGKDFTRLSDQLLVLGEQHHRMFRLKDQVDVLIHDSPFVMGLVYLQNDPHLPQDIYEDLVITMFKSYKNLNVFLKRSDHHPYQEYGRNQSLDAAMQKDDEIKAMLDKHDIEYIEVLADEFCINNIENIITEYIV